MGLFTLLSTHADRQGVDISVTVRFLFVCTVTDFSGEDKASGIKFCTVVYGHSGQGISLFGELSSHKRPQSDESATDQEVKFRVKSYHNCVHINIARRVDVGFVCVDILPSPKMGVLVIGLQVAAC